METKTLTQEIIEVATLSEWKHPSTGEVRLYVNEDAPYSQRGSLAFLLGGVKSESYKSQRAYKAQAWDGEEWVNISNSRGTAARVEGKVYYSLTSKRWVGIINEAVIEALTALLPAEEEISEAKAAAEEKLVEKQKEVAKYEFLNALRGFLDSEQEEVSATRNLLLFMSESEILEEKWSRARRPISVERVKELLNKA